MTMHKHIAIGLVIAVMACKTSSILGLSAVAPAQAKELSFYPACMSKTCSFGYCTEDWAGGKPLTKKGICACQKSGGTAYLSANVVAKKCATK